MSTERPGPLLTLNAASVAWYSRFHFIHSLMPE
jgi:hypothetical protein